MLKIALVSGAPPQTPLGSLRRSPKPPSRKGLLAFHKFPKVCLLLKLSLATPLYIHTYIHTHIHTYVYIHTYTHTPTHTHTHTHTYIHTYIHTHIHTYIHACM